MIIDNFLRSQVIYGEILIQDWEKYSTSSSQRKTSQFSDKNSMKDLLGF